MIKAMGTMGGKPLLIFGLSRENVTRLMAQKPIAVNVAALGGPEMTVLLVGGRTEDDIHTELGKHFRIAEFRDERGGGN